MAMFLVDLTTIDENKREEVIKQIRQYSGELVLRVVDKHGKMEGAKVIWTSTEDFESSSVFPKGCKCTRLAN